MSESSPVLCVSLARRPGGTLTGRLRRLAAQRAVGARRIPAEVRRAAGVPELSIPGGGPGSDPAPGTRHDKALALLEVAARLGCRTVVVTAPPETEPAVPIEFDGLIDEVFLAPTAPGDAPEDAIARALLDAYGGEGFVYADCGEGDLVLWGFGESGRMSAPLLSALGADGAGKRATPAALWARQLRVHQWSKNALVFVPLVLTWRTAGLLGLAHTVLMFAAFCLLASATYIANDVYDRELDAAHPTKRDRPIASGAIPVRSAVSVAAAMAAAALAIAGAIGLPALGAVALYGVATTVYSRFLKRRPVADVIALAGLYTVRVVAGCAALSVLPTVWLLMFSGCIFFSLALMKRCVELGRERAQLEGRGYLVSDRAMLLMLGASSGVVAVLVFVLYVVAVAPTGNYATPLLLLADVPLLLYWVCRAWLLTNRGAMRDDPILYALTDRASLLVGSMMVLIGAVAAVVPL